MNNIIIGAALGLITGGILGGYFGSRVCHKAYETELEELKGERDCLKEENEALREMVIEKREKVIEKKEKQLKKTEYKPEPRPEIKQEIGEEDDIRLIDEEEFKLNYDFRDNDTVTYYQQNQVLVGSDDIEIRNHEGFLGRECAAMIDDTDKDFLYIDDCGREVMHEIIVDHNADYYRDVLGIG